MIGHVDIISRERIGGWAADPVHPHKEVLVRVIINGQPIGVVANLMREDLMSICDGATGKYGFDYRVAPYLMPSFTNNLVEVLFEGSGSPIPEGRATLAALNTRPVDATRLYKPAPLVIAGSGRSGSSLLMARLASHPEIIVAREHPYELKLLTYYALALRTLLSKADRERSTNPDTMAADINPFFIGFNPFNDLVDAREPSFFSYWNSKLPTMLRDCAAQVIDAYYALVAENTGKSKPKFFAEKIANVDYVRAASAFIFGPIHEIVLVRDPRDIICSSKSFWRQEFSVAVESMEGQFASMIQPRLEVGLRQHVLRYEDLVLHPQESMARVFSFLELSKIVLDFDLDAEARVFAIHGTRSSPADTIGRWRRDLTPQETEIATQKLRPYLELYDYPLS